MGDVGDSLYMEEVRLGGSGRGPLLEDVLRGTLGRSGDSNE